MARQGAAGRWVAALAIVALTGAVQRSWAADDAPGSRAGWLSDPLLSEPAVLQRGLSLPGDAAPLSCEQIRPDAAQALSLAEAVRMALCANPRVQQAWAGIRLQAAALGQARSAYLPRLTASAERLRDTTWVNAGNVSNVQRMTGDTAYAALTWRLLDFGARGANLEAADDLLAAALATNDATLQQTMAVVVQAYFDAQAAQAAWTSRQQSVSIARSTLETAQRREAAGAGSTSETLQARTALAWATLESNRAEGSLGQAKAALANAIALPVEAGLLLPPLQAPRTPRIGQALADWLAEARSRHPAIVAAQQQVSAAQARVAAAKAEGLPSLDFSVSYYRNGRPDQGLSGIATHERQLGLTLTIPLFEGFERTYKVRGAETQVDQREADLREVQQRVAMEVAQAYAAAAAALANLEASEALLQTATASQASSRRRYEKGVADILEVLNTQQALSEAEQQRSRSLSEWYAASLRVVAAAGRLGASDLHPS